VIGRWNVVDPLADSYYSWSHTLGNPIKFIDPNGMWVGPIFDDRTGDYLGVDSKGFLDGEILFMNRERFYELEKRSKTGIIDHDIAVENSMSIADLPESKEGFILFNKATDMISKTLNKVFYGEDPTDFLHGGRVATSSKNLGIKTRNSDMLDFNVFGQNTNFLDAIDIVTMNFDRR